MNCITIYIFITDKLRYFRYWGDETTSAETRSDGLLNLLDKIEERKKQRSALRTSTKEIHSVVNDETAQERTCVDKPAAENLSTLNLNESRVRKGSFHFEPLVKKSKLQDENSSKEVESHCRKSLEKKSIQETVDMNSNFTIIKGLESRPVRKVCITLWN